MNYHLVAPDIPARLRVKVLLGGDTPRVSSVTGIWPSAGFLEREVWDLMGVVFDGGHPEDPDEPGGPIFRVANGGDPGIAAHGGGAGAAALPRWRLGFGNPGPVLARVGVGDRVWITSDPMLARGVERMISTEPTGRHAVDLVVSGAAGRPLEVAARSWAHLARAASTTPLTPARGAGLDAALLADKLGALGGTPLRLDRLDAHRLAPGLHLPVSELKELRRRLVSALVAAIERGPARALAATPVLDAMHAAASGPRRAAASGREAAPRLLPLCRTDAQLDAVIAAGCTEVELDWMELVGLGRAVARARAAGLGVTLATVRVQKVGEEGYDARLARLAPDAILVRHWGAVVHFLEQPPTASRPALHGDFSLNVTNSVTAAHLLDLGLDTLTCAHDLDATQLFALLERAPANRFTIPLHHHIATFHTEHCVYAHLLSNGRDYRSCGRPCEAHQVALRDRVGMVHPVIVDVGCRNTVFNAQAQSAAELVPRLLERGVRRFRVELVRESATETGRVLAAYRDLLAGRITPREAIQRAGAHEQFGVTRGTMRVLG